MHTVQWDNSLFHEKWKKKLPLIWMKLAVAVWNETMEINKSFLCVFCSHYRMERQ